MREFKKWLLEQCWFRNMFLSTPCNTPFCCSDWCTECDKQYGPREEEGYETIEHGGAE